MNTFRFKFNKAVWVLLAVAIIITAAGLAFDIYSLIHFRDKELFQRVSYILMAAVVAVLLMLMVSLAVYSKYVIKNGILYCYFGFIKTKSAIADIVQITRFQKDDKLVVYFKDQTYTVIVISPDRYEPFIEELKKVNQNVIVQIDLGEEQK